MKVEVTIKQCRAEIKDWAEENKWLMIKSSPALLTYVSPSGNIVNFMFTEDTLCCDVFEGRRQGE